MAGERYCFDLVNSWACRRRSYQLNLADGVARHFGQAVSGFGHVVSIARVDGNEFLTSVPMR